MKPKAVFQLFAELRSRIREEDPLKTLEELQNRFQEEEQSVEKQKRVYEDEINILKEASNVSGDEAKFRLISMERELKNLKRENLETKVSIDSVNRKNRELNDEVERLEQRSSKIQEDAARFRGQWVWNLETLKEQKDILNRDMLSVQDEFKNHLKEWADTIVLMKQKSSDDKAQVKDRLFEGLYRFLAQQKNLIVNEERTLLSGLANFIQNQIGGLGGTAMMLKERARHMIPLDNKLDVANLLKLSPQQLQNELEFIIKILNEKSEAIEKLERGLKDFGSLNRQPRMKPEKLELADALEEWISSDVEFLNQNQIIIEKNLSKNFPIIIDKNLLILALRELAQNAGENGDMRAMVQIRTEADPSKNWVGLSFEDNGPGIPAHLKDKIFLPFFTTRKNRSGLGLSKALRWISLMGGELSLEPSSKGAKFLVRFPIYESISLDTP